MTIYRLLRTLKKILYDVNYKKKGYVCLKLLINIDDESNVKQRICLIEVSPHRVSKPQENITARISLTDLQEFVLRCNEFYPIPTRKIFDNIVRPSKVEIENKEIWVKYGKRLGFWKRRKGWNLFKDKHVKEEK